MTAANASPVSPEAVDISEARVLRMAGIAELNAVDQQEVAKVLRALSAERVRLEKMLDAPDVQESLLRRLGLFSIYQSKANLEGELAEVREVFGKLIKDQDAERVRLEQQVQEQAARIAKAAALLDPVIEVGYQPHASVGLSRIWFGKAAEWIKSSRADAESTRRSDAELRKQVQRLMEARDEACDYLRRAGAIIAMKGDQQMALSCAKNADRLQGCALVPAAAITPTDSKDAP